MKSINLFLGVLILVLIPVLLNSQTDCNPDAGGGIAKSGSLFMNFGSSTNAVNASTKSNITIGQPAIGASLNSGNILDQGYWSQLLLPPKAPKVTATQGDYPDRVSIAWNFDPLSSQPTDGFVIERDGSFLAKVEPELTQFIDFNVQAGENYVYSVKGVNDFGTGTGGSAIGFINPNGVVSGRVITRNGTPVEGATVKLDPMSGTSLSFDGVNDYVCMSYKNTLPSNAWTVSAWVKLATPNSSNNSKGIIDFGSDVNSNMWIKTNSTGNGISAGFGDGTTDLTVSNLFSTAVNGWHHVSIVYAGSTMILYVDANYIGTVKGTIDTIQSLFRIGSLRNGTGFFKGKIDDVRIYNRMLTQTEIMSSLDITASRSTNGLVGYWKFDEGIGEKVFDISPSDIDGYLQGATFSNDIPNVANGAVTDNGGFYTIDAINYSSEQSFMATPSKNFYKNFALEFNAVNKSRVDLVNFDLPVKSTVELLVYPFNKSDQQSLLYKRTGANSNFQLKISDEKYYLLLNNETKELGPIGNGYQHIALSMDGSNNTVSYYLNGAFQNTIPFIDVDRNWNTGNWQLGYVNTTNNTQYFTGLIDEVAFFDTLLTQTEIQFHASNALTAGVDTGDDHLLSYFQLNEGLGTVIDDFGKLMTAAGTVTNATFSPNAFRYEELAHEFSPGTRQVNINASNTAVSMIDFTDISTVAITGVIRFENTFCFNKEVEILVNGASHNPPIFTDEDGRFVADFDPGSTVKLSPVFEDHSFSPPFYEARTLLNPIAGVLFQNTTKRSLEGQVWGGNCKLPVISPPSDKVIFELRSDNGCFVARDTVTSADGKYSFTNIPPIAYSIGVAAGSTNAIYNYFNTLGGSAADLKMVEKDTIDFEYFSVPQVEIFGNENDTCLNKPLLISGVEYDTKIKVFEAYINEKCYLDSAVVSVTNNVADMSQRSYQMTEGIWKVTYNAGLPNFIPPFNKTISVAITTNDGRTANTAKTMVVTGEKRLPNAVLSTNPPIYPFYILRDPPGDGSYATMEANKQVCREFGMTGTFQTEAGASVTVGTNLPLIPLIGLTAGGGSISANYNYTYTKEKERKAELCVSLSESISTPESDEFVGSDGDTYVGATLNIGYGKNLRLAKTGCLLAVDTTYSVELEGFASDFIYTEKHIREVVIPLAQEVGDDFTALRWNQLIERNAELKDLAKEPADLGIKVNESNVPTSGNNIVELLDRDGDGINDADDPCPWHAGKSNCGDDYDLDGVYDELIIFGAKAPWDNCRTVHNPDQLDTDRDGVGDACDSDIDGDGHLNTNDNCIYTSNDQVDSNGDGIGNACENDLDGDGVQDFSDNCPYYPNPIQVDSDGDGIGNLCERDNDQDGKINDYDKCPNVVGEDCNTNTNLNDELTLGDVRKNITFSAGTSYSSSWAQDTVIGVSEAQSDDHTAGLDVEIVAGDQDDGPLYGVVSGHLAFNWGHGQYESNNKTSSTVVSYSLADDDAGDFFTFDVLSDTRYKTPVFRLKGGDSSCPYEGPPTRNRDGVNFLVDNNSATNVGENDKAVFYLDIGNISPTDETRTYIIKPVAESNPNGASILIGGQSEQTLAIRGGKQIRMVMTVEKGPVEFVYDSLRIAMYTECEYDQATAEDGGLDPLFYKEVVVDVQFIQGCSEVDVVFPLQDWVLTDPNPVTAKQSLQLSNYDENDPTLLEIRTQYRLVGGSGIWINFDTIPKASLGTASTYTDWFIGDLSDAFYEVRAVSICNPGLAPGSSDFIQGKLERYAPELFGTPEPADGVLSPGDEISITFNEGIRCNEIYQADGIGSNINYNNLALFDLTEGRLIDATITCLDNKIIIVPNVGNNFIENHTLKVITNNIKDLAGNESEQISWEFYVNRSNLYWTGAAINEKVLEGNTLDVTREIRNQGGVFTNYKLENVPDWMEVFPREGTVAPGGIQLVHFLIPANLVNGKYASTIVLHPTDGSGDELLKANVRVLCPEPEWEYDPSDYSFSMNLTLQLNIEGNLSNDELDKVGAFVNGELRGIGYINHIESINKHLVFLTVYSDTAIGETIAFQIWDASDCQLYGSTIETFPFVVDDLIGSPNVPQTIHTDNQLLRKIYFHPGWNWFSYNVNQTIDSLNNTMATLTNPDGGFIKNQIAFSEYFDNTFGWFGDLVFTNNLTMYQFKTNSYDSLTLVGSPVNPETPIPLVAGWNWIGYLPQQGLPINVALDSLSASNGDIIKSQLSFAQYVAGFGWIGNLEYMNSPNGYQMKLANAAVLTYPASAPNNNIDNNPVNRFNRNVQILNYGKLDIDQVSYTSLQNYWKITPENFEYNMNMIALVSSSDIENVLDENDEIGAFVGNELRGSGKAILIPGLDAYIVFITMFANREGELINFKYYDSANDKVHALVENIPFRINEIVGSIGEPQILSLITTSIKDANTNDEGFKIYPNPTSSHVYLNFEINNIEIVSIKLFNNLGQLINSRDVKAQSGNNIIEYSIPRNASSGQYIIELKTSEKLYKHKVEFVK